MLTQGGRVCHPASEGRFSGLEEPGKAIMMDEAIKTHKETAFGWVLMIQEWLAARRARLARLARQQAAEAARTAPRRHLGPR
jgi:hypothetical protein